jgi:long-chain acyl-CoA synthetase
MSSPDLRRTLDSLAGRYRPGVVERKTTYYLSLGDAPDEKWTVTLTPTSCELTPGKVDKADCVLKMAAELFVKLVAGTFKPGAMDLLSGKMKTNDIDLLRRLQQAFDL